MNFRKFSRIFASNSQFQTLQPNRQNFWKSRAESGETEGISLIMKSNCSENSQFSDNQRYVRYVKHKNNWCSLKVCFRKKSRNINNMSKKIIVFSHRPTVSVDTDVYVDRHRVPSFSLELNEWRTVCLTFDLIEIEPTFRISYVTLRLRCAFSSRRIYWPINTVISNRTAAITVGG